MKIDIPELLLHLRAEIVDGEANGAAAETRVKKKFAERIAFAAYGYAWRHPWIYRLGIKTARQFQRPYVNEGRIRRLTGLAARIASPVIAWTNDRDAPPVAPRTFREIWKSEQTDRRTSTSDD